MSDFARAAVGFIRDRALQVQEKRDYELVELAAYLFAVGCELLTEDRNARMRRRRSRRAAGSSVEETLDALARLSPDISAPELYWTLLDALLVFENEICRRTADAEALPSKTELEEVRFGDGELRGLGGDVYHWIRPRSVLAQERESRYQGARRRPPDPEPHPGTYLSRLGMYWHSDRQLPRLDWFRPGDRTIPLIQESGRDAAHRGRFRIALCPLPGDFHPLFQVWPHNDLFQTADPGMAGPTALASHLEKLMRAATDQKIHLLVMPELTIDPPARAILSRLLAEVSTDLPYGLVAGSFHVRDCSGDAPCANESVLLDRTGTPLVTHRKRGRFRFPSAFLAAAPGFFSRVHSEPADEIYEDIQDGTELHFLETSLGRLALLICADGIAADDKGYLPVIQRLRPDLLFVVSMSPKTKPFEEFFKAMAEFWVGTLFVNAHCICRFGKLPLLAASNLALFEPVGSPPGRIRWLYEGTHPEYAPPPSADKEDLWQPLPGDAGVSWLEWNNEVLGLVVDLGVHFENRK